MSIFSLLAARSVSIFDDAGVREALLQRRAQREILVQQLRVVAVRVPARPPGLVEAEAESERMNLLAHSYSSRLFFLSPSLAFFDGVVADFSARRTARRALRLGAVRGDRHDLLGRSDTCTVRCAVRFSTRNARPIGAGRTRFCDGPWFA